MLHDGCPTLILRRPSTAEWKPIGAVPSNATTMQLRTCAECRNRAAQAQRAFANTLKALGTPFVDRVAAVSNAGFPTPDDLITIRDTAEDLPNRDHAYSELRVLQGDREQTARDIRILEESVTAVGAPADVTAALADLKQIEQKLVTLRSSHSLAEDVRVAAESAESEGLFKQRELNLRVIQIAGAVAKEEAAIESAGSQRDAAIMTLPEMERATAITVTAEILRTHAEELSQLESDKVQEQFARSPTIGFSRQTGKGNSSRCRSRSHGCPQTHADP